MVGGDLRCAWPAECGAAVGVFHGFQNSCCILVGSLLTARSIRLRALSSRGGWRHNTYLAGVRGGQDEHYSHYRVGRLGFGWCFCR